MRRLSRPLRPQASWRTPQRDPARDPRPDPPPARSAVAILVLGVAIGVAIGLFGALYAADLRQAAPEPRPEPLPSRAAQLAEGRRLGLQLLTVVADAGAKGRGVFFAGDAPLAAKATVALYRSLLVRGSVWRAWGTDGTLRAGVADWWRAYAIEFTGDADGKHTWHDVWMALPVGDAGALDEPSWWVHGPLADGALDAAVRALNGRILVDWRRPGRSRATGLQLMNAHLINEPSADEEENIGGMNGARCADGLDWCGTVLEAKASRAVRPGDELLWCYGEGYARSYEPAAACADDAARLGAGGPAEEPPRGVQHTAF